MQWKSRLPSTENVRKERSFINVVFRIFSFKHHNPPSQVRNRDFATNWISNLYTFPTRCRRPLMFQTMNSAILNSFTPFETIKDLENLNVFSSIHRSLHDGETIFNLITLGVLYQSRSITYIMDNHSHS